MRIVVAMAGMMLLGAAPAKTPADVVAAAPAAAWKAIAADDLLVLDLERDKRVVIQLAPHFAPVHVANIRKLARASWWEDAGVYRVQDNYVAQWGQGETKKPLPAGVIERPPARILARVEGHDAAPAWVFRRLRNGCRLLAGLAGGLQPGAGLGHGSALLWLCRSGPGAGSRYWLRS